MPERVETTDPDGVDYGWVMQTTFVLTIVIGAPVVAALSLFVTLPNWPTRAEFAVRVGQSGRVTNSDSAATTGAPTTTVRTKVVCITHP